MNVYRPTAGKILFNGIETTDPRAFRKNRAYLQSARQIIFFRIPIPAWIPSGRPGRSLPAHAIAARYAQTGQLPG